MAQTTAGSQISDIDPLPPRPKNSNFFFEEYNTGSYRKEAQQVINSCNYLGFMRSREGFSDLYYLVEDDAYRVNTYAPLKDHPALIADKEITLDFFGGLWRSVEQACDGAIIASSFHSGLADCATPEARRKALARLRFNRFVRLLRQRKRELSTALSLGPNASKIRIDPRSDGLAAPSTGHLQKIIKEMEAALPKMQAATDPCPPEKKEPPKKEEKEEKTKKPISFDDDQAQGEPISDDPCPMGTTEPICTRWDWLLGNWTSDAGGVIAFRLVGDTVSASVVSATERMEQEGYSAGMQVIRGLRFGGQGQGTWAWHAEKGEVFEAARPDREPGEVYGTAKWTPNVLVYINQDQPDVLHIPPQLEARMSNFKKWHRSDSAY
ncbi:hypothetical protein [Parerythrobacter aestuarii]|uniref:hypothetical protein n=1 Tax=Parerythrobacter aestuarii TaxID=3020909 RepID=UPI0024DE05EB|nr:hypothetical protein [Parerythrobacter aestuarii]